MKLFIVAAVANNNVIGQNNQLIWHMPADLKRFKELTTGNTILMGRKTFESIGKALPNRKTIVVSRKKDLKHENCVVVNSLKDAFCYLKDHKINELYVAGGGEIYRQVINLHFTKKMYITRIYANFEGDSFFPDINPDKWELIEHEEQETDEKNPYPYSFQVYKKKK